MVRSSLSRDSLTHACASIRFLFIGSYVRTALPSDPPSRTRPCALLILRPIRLDKGLSPSGYRTCSSRPPLGSAPLSRGSPFRLGLPLGPRRRAERKSCLMRTGPHRPKRCASTTWACAKRLKTTLFGARESVKHTSHAHKFLSRIRKIDYFVMNNLGNGSNALRYIIHG